MRENQDAKPAVWDGYPRRGRRSARPAAKPADAAPALWPFGSPDRWPGGAAAIEHGDPAPRPPGLGGGLVLGGGCRRRRGCRGRRRRGRGRCRRAATPHLNRDRSRCARRSTSCSPTRPAARAEEPPGQRRLDPKGVLNAGTDGTRESRRGGRIRRSRSSAAAVPGGAPPRRRPRHQVGEAALEHPRRGLLRLLHPDRSAAGRQARPAPNLAGPCRAQADPNKAMQVLQRAVDRCGQAPTSSVVRAGRKRAAARPSSVSSDAERRTRTRCLEASAGSSGNALSDRPAPALDQPRTRQGFTSARRAAHRARRPAPAGAEVGQRTRRTIASPAAPPDQPR